MRVPQADYAFPPIPTETITVDGDISDWDPVAPYIADIFTLEDNCTTPGSDIDAQ